MISAEHTPPPGSSGTSGPGFWLKVAVVMALVAAVGVGCSPGQEAASQVPQAERPQTKAAQSPGRGEITLHQAPT